MRKTTVLLLLLCQLFNTTFISASIQYILNKSVDTPTHHIQFRWAGDLIILQATVNDISGYLVLDTGIDGLILNKEYFQGKRSSIELLDPSGETQLAGTIWAEVNINGFYFKNESAYVIDISKAYNKGTPILGFVGWKAFSKYRLVIDHQNRKLVLIPQKSNEDVLVTTLNGSLSKSLPLFRSGNVWLTTLQFDGQSFSLLVDSGAETNLITEKVKKRLFTHISIKGEAQVNFFGCRKKLQKIQIKHLPFNGKPNQAFDAVVLPQVSFNQIVVGRKIDGIIGSNFLKKYELVVLDFIDHRIILYQQFPDSKNDFVHHPFIDLSINNIFH